MHVTTRLTKILLITMAIALMAGCAFGTRKATLIYPPTNEQATSGDNKASLEQRHKNINVVVQKFTDGREDKTVIGTVRNGLGMKTADVVSANSVSDWVAESVSKELSNNGYTLKSDTSPQDPGDITISGEVLNAFCDMYLKYNALVAVNISAVQNGNQILNKTYQSTGSAGVVWSASAEAFAESLAMALSSALKEFGNDLDNATHAAQPNK